MKLTRRLADFVNGLLSPGNRRALRHIHQLQRMVKAVDATEETEIACDEAYRLLDEYAELVFQGEDAASLMPQVSHHVALCLDCREELEALLRALSATRGET